MLLKEALSMNARMLSVLVVLWAASCLFAATPASAQGLIWSLPPDGTWVRYEGKYTYIERREQAAVKNIAPWTKHLTIKSVGTSMRDVGGAMTPCRWIEIIAITGRDSEAGVDTGPLGTWKYRVLVPEPAVVGELVDDEIPVSMLPVIEGQRKLGDKPVEEITSGVLQVYPVLTLLEHYRQWDGEAGEPEAIDVPLGQVEAVHRTAKLVTESRRYRSTNTGELWLGLGNPQTFGLAKWKVTVLREEKDATQPRSAFQPTNELIEEMEAHASGADAQPDADLGPLGE
jgi:hypothetical protein